MSVTGDYMLILGMDQPEWGSADREWFNKGLADGDLMLDDSMERLAILIDKVDWDGDDPSRGRFGSHMVYYWENTHGPYFREGPQVYPPVERLIEKVKKDFPNCERHYTKLWWVEHQLYQVEGMLLQHNGPEITNTIVVGREGPGTDLEDIREHFLRKGVGL